MTLLVGQAVAAEIARFRGAGSEVLFLDRLACVDNPCAYVFAARGGLDSVSDSAIRALAHRLLETAH